MSEHERPTAPFISEPFITQEWFKMPTRAEAEAKPFTYEDFRAAVQAARDNWGHLGHRPQRLVLSPTMYRIYDWHLRTYKHRIIFPIPVMNRIVAPRLTRFLDACKHCQRRVRSWRRRHFGEE